MINSYLPPLPTAIIGFEKELAELKTKLLASSADETPVHSIVGVQGFPGVGKTTLVAMLAHDHDVQAKFSDGVLWLSLGSSPDLLMGLKTWGRILNSETIKNARTVKQASEILTNILRDKKMLLVLDDVWNTEHIMPFQVGGKFCATLITARGRFVTQQLTPNAQIYALSALSSEDSLKLLGIFAPQVVMNYPNEALELVENLEGLPLAIQVAGRMLQTESGSGADIREVLENLKERTKLLSSEAPSDRRDLVNETSPTVAALIFSTINKLDEHTRKCYANLGVFAPKPATFDINAMASTWEMKDPRPVVRTLVEYGLLEYIPEIDRYQIHPLLSKAAQTLLEDSQTPTEIQYSDTEAAIKSYFLQEKHPLYEAKILFVGQGSVGKTSLVRRLTLNEFDLNETKTEGISIDHIQVSNQSEIENQQSKIRLNIWDFGGQEIMHATHQFFLTKRSLYLLVLDSRLTQEENRVEYWLKIIQSFGGESPVLIVGNKIDQHPLDIDRTGLQKKYPNIVGILETSAATGAGIEELKAAITEQVNSLPHVRDLLPETWFTVKTKLEELGKQSNFITHDKYLELCAENEVSDETSQRTLIGFLHDLGVVLHFQDDPRLEALGILNPQWVTNGVYKILNSHTLFQNKGVLTLAMLNTILNIDGYPRGKRLFIVDMMKKFELCYDIEPDKTFLVPDLLPKEEPTELKFNGIPAFEYAYPVLPSSVITRLIVRMNQHIDGDCVWRTGVVLIIGDNTALVKADIEDRKITIAIDGLEHTRRDALSAIRYQLDEIHGSIKGLNPEKRVPIPEAPNAEPVEYEYLLMLERAGDETCRVKDGNRLVTVNVRQVLSAIEHETERKERGMTNIHIGNITIGENAKVGDIILASEIQESVRKAESSNIPPELMETLKLLGEAVDIMNKVLPKEQAKETAEDFGKLVDEATKPTPNRKWYSVSVEGLIKAAENVEKVGVPVINLSRKALSLLTGGVIK